MLAKRSTIFGGLAGVALTATFAPAAIKYQIGTGTIQDFPANGQIAVTVPANTTVTLHLYDDNGGAASGINLCH